MNLRLALALLFAVAFLTGGGLRLIHDHTDTPPPPPTPTSSSTTADPLVWYRSLPTATGCPKSVPAGLKPFYPQCPNVQEEDPE